MSDFHPLDLDNGPDRRWRRWTLQLCRVSSCQYGNLVFSIHLVKEIWMTSTFRIAQKRQNITTCKVTTILAYHFLVGCCMYVALNSTPSPLGALNLLSNTLRRGNERNGTALCPGHLAMDTRGSCDVAKKFILKSSVFSWKAAIVKGDVIQLIFADDPDKRERVMKSTATSGENAAIFKQRAEWYPSDQEIALWYPIRLRCVCRFFVSSNNFCTCWWRTSCMLVDYSCRWFSVLICACYIYIYSTIISNYIFFVASWS